ncbi:hypothetical protein PUR71_18890 [Streptomyces sp. SP17BM10]|uniref:hypothetical protein n=1 Tax=Streptomyces sp. SP17BM10 TaxID=3002530 RepID=UPI002E7A98B9|nr:hypothetical protein [Streptomyces sp. SP17BM10]MEE1784959.1 hypothetical protein [Streptomyces sp. SP17BM10]
MGSITKAGLAVGSVLLLAACSSGGGGSNAGPAPSGASARATVPTYTPPPTPTRPPYGPVLTGAVDPVTTALGKVTTAKTLADLDTVLAEIATSARTGSLKLRTADQPPEVGITQSDLASALTQLGTDMTKVQGDIKHRTVCGLSAGLAEVGQAAGLKAVTTALGTMATAGYPTTFAVPQLPAAQNRSLDNGTMVRKGRLNGEGVFKVDNGGSSDAVVTLALDGKAVNSVYVAKGSNASIEGVQDGTYEVYFSGGADWDGDAKAFTQNCRFTKFQDTLAFETGRTATSWSITLKPVVGGNAKTEDVDQQNFPQP